MVSIQRALLPLHIEAVWGVQLPPIIQNNVEPLSESSQPSWKLCAAEMDSDRVSIWRPDVIATERENLLVRVNEVLALPPPLSVAPGISREVALHQVALPTIGVAANAAVGAKEVQLRALRADGRGVAVAADGVFPAAQRTTVPDHWRGFWLATLN